MPPWAATEWDRIGMDLREDRHVELGIGGQGRGQPGQPAADDEDIVADHHSVVPGEVDDQQGGGDDGAEAGEDPEEELLLAHGPRSMMTVRNP